MSDGVLRGLRVVIRPVRADDAGTLVALRTTPEVARWWDPPAPDWPMNSTEAHRYTVLVDDRIVGFVQWYENDDPEYRHAGIDVFVGPRWHGRGLGRETVGVVLRHLLDDVGHHRVVIDPAAGNTAAIACYRACGFREVGVMRFYERHAGTGEWHDGLLMEHVVDPTRPRPADAGTGSGIAHRAE